MATRALQQVICYTAWNTSTNAYVTGDSGNHSLSWAKDGTRSAATNAAAEVDSTNMPGLYKCTITSTETDCIEGVLGGKSSTANVVLIPTMVAFDYLNTSAPATAGIPDVNAKNIGNTAQTGRDIGASVLLSSGTGTGQVKLSSGYVAPNWGDVGNPSTTVNLSATTVAVTAAVTGLTASNLDATVSSRLASASITLSGGIVSADVKKVNAVTVIGAGTSGDLWRA